MQTARNLLHSRKSIWKSMVVKVKNEHLRVRWERVLKNWIMDTWRNFCFSGECSAVIGGGKLKKMLHIFLSTEIEASVYNGLGSDSV